MNVPVHAAADLAWSEGAAAEEAYDFEAARESYRLAAASASGAAALDYVTRYAGFLVERFGQFDEVAAWLDDPAFAAPVGHDSHAQTLARLLARAAQETQHPRQAEVDERAAAAGDVAALERAAQRQADRGETEAARQRLESAAAQLGPSGQKLLGRLRQAALDEAVAACQPAEDALAAGREDDANAHLQRIRAKWGHSPHFHALEFKVRGALDERTRSQFLADVHAALTRGDLTGAEAAAVKLVALPHPKSADREALQQIRQLRKQREVGTAWHKAQAATTVPGQLQVLARLVDEHGADHEAPPDVATLWQAVRQAAQLPHALPLSAKLPALEAWVRVLDVLQSPDPHAWSDALRGLPEAWSQAPAAQKLRDRLKQHDQAQRDAAEAEVVAGVQALLDAGDLDAAHRELDLGQKRLPQSAGLKALRAELSHLRHDQERRDRLRQAITDALGRDDVLTARVRLGELAHFITPDERTSLHDAIESRAATLLKAKAMPPGLQKLQNAPLLTGVGLGRMVIVQETVWLTVNLETGGIAPFALPAGWPVQIHAWTRIGVVGDRLRLVGVSKERLVVIEQVPGQPPQVVSGVPLAELLADDDTLMGAALTPDATTWALLSRSSTRGTAPSWTRIDATTLAVLDRKKAQPKLDSLAGIDGLPDAAFVVAAPKHRSEYAAAITDLSGSARHRLSGDDVGEPIAGVREAVCWPAQDRIYARFSGFNPFTGQPANDPSLLVVSSGRVTFASMELRKRFAPLDKLAIDHAWTLDQHAGRLWFAAQSTAEGEPATALLLGVQARTLRADKPVAVDGVERLLALHPVPDGAVALSRLAGGGFGLTRARLDDGSLALTTQRLPL